MMPLLATSIVLLALLGDRTFLRMSPTEADPYHAAVKKAVESLPTTFGSWLGIDVPVPTAAVKMLHPNVILSRQFRNIATNENVTFLIVHVKDARDILGHYPPVCYPAQGWKIDEKQASDWPEGERSVQGTEYKFSRDRVDTSANLVVDNFLISRGGQTCRDMDGIELAAQDRSRRLYGAAQVQIATELTMSPARRRAIVKEFIAYSEPALQAISGGEKYEQ